jgi:hypothetical protein
MVNLDDPSSYSTNSKFEPENLPSENPSKSTSALEEENSRLLETKNALNVVKDDLLKELEEMSNRYAVMKLEMTQAKRDKGKSLLLLWLKLTLL